MKAIVRFIKHIRKTAVTVLAILAIVLPPLLLLVPVVGIPSQYNRTFYGGLDGKVKRLDSVEEDKLVVIGGSSVAFGLNSALLEELIGMPVVNFGLYADLGTKLMLDLSEDAIGEGDVVVIAPELDPQTLSMYFNGSATWMAIDDDPALLLRIKSENYSSMWGALWSFAAAKLGCFLRGEKPEQSSVYHSKYFNERGDIVYTLEDGADGRPENIIAGYYDTVTPIDPDISIFDGEFLDYLNRYIRRMEKRGAKVYFGFCPSNRMAVVDGSGECLGSAGKSEENPLPSEKIAEFSLALAKALDCEILGSFDKYVYLPHYFYDTNFHLNSAGVTLHTLNLADDLYRALYGKASPEIAGAERPAPPELPVRLPNEHLVLTDPAYTVTVGDLILCLDERGGYRVVGVSDAGRGKSTLILPTEATVTYAVGGESLTVTYPISIIGTDAFRGVQSVRRVVISPDARMQMLEDDCFAGSGVRELYLFCPVDGFAAGFFQSGTASDFVTYVPRGSDYLIDYFWESVAKTTTDKSFSDFAN